MIKKIQQFLCHHEYKAINMYTVRVDNSGGIEFHSPCCKCGKEYVAFFSDDDIESWIYRSKCYDDKDMV